MQCAARSRRIELPLCLAALSLAFTLLLPLAAAWAVPPPSPELTRRLKATGRYQQVVEQLEAARARGLFAPSAEVTPLGANSAGKITVWKSLVILVDFSDAPATGLYNQPEWNELLFSQGSLSTGSMNDFYLENSYGSFAFDGVVVGWYRMPHPLSYYCNYDGIPGTSDDYGFGSYPHNAQTLYEDAIHAADPDVDFSQYRNGRYSVQGVFIVHAGPGAETTGDPSDIWSHRSSFSVGTSDGVSVTDYTFEPELQGSGQSTMGVFSHEFGHVLGLPDLYDTDSSSAGIGSWSVMYG